MIVVLSGGFDPIHVGHVRMIQAAAQFAPVVILGLNSNEWLIRKKGKAFMSFEERREILLAIHGVTHVVAFNDDDNTASDLLRCVRKENPVQKICFGNGGDRTTENVPEQATCKELDIEMMWSLGGGKVQSSSSLIKEGAK